MYIIGENIPGNTVYSSGLTDTDAFFAPFKYPATTTTTTHSYNEQKMTRVLTDDILI